MMQIEINKELEKFLTFKEENQDFYEKIFHYYGCS